MSVNESAECRRFARSSEVISHRKIIFSQSYLNYTQTISPSFFLSLGSQLYSFASMLQFVRALVITSTLTGYVYSFPTLHWPNPLLTYADKQLYEGPLDELVSSCSPRDHTTVSAQWLRLVSGKFSSTNVRFIFALAGLSWHVNPWCGIWNWRAGCIDHVWAW